MVSSTSRPNSSRCSAVMVVRKYWISTSRFRTKTIWATSEIPVIQLIGGSMKWLAVGLGVAMLWGSVAAANAQATKTITMRDACDPTTFNAVLGPGVCMPGHHGNTLFPDFIGELQTDQIAGAWRFNPMLNTTEGNLRLARLDLRSGDQ